MMPAGFQVWGDHGFLQIDQDYRNYALVAKGTNAVHGPPTITDPVAPVLVLYSTAGGVVPVGITISGTTWGWNVVSSPAGVDYEWYIYDVPPPSTATFGLVIYNAAGEVAFDATRKYMRVIADNAAVGATDSSNGSVFTEPAGRKYGYAPRTVPVYTLSESGEPGVTWYYFQSLYTDGNTIRNRQVQPFSEPIHTPSQPSMNGAFAFFDITDH